MFGQFAVLPPWWRVPGAGAGVELDDAGSVWDDDDEPSDDELLSLCPHAAAAPPSMSPTSPAAAIACFSRKVMSFTSFGDLSRPSMNGEAWIAL
jgi:hypothetical protein